MKYEEWLDLSERLAVELWAQEAVAVMIPVREAWEAALAAKHAARTDLSDPSVQRWRKYVHEAGSALIALETLGYEFSKAATDVNPASPHPAEQ